MKIFLSLIFSIPFGIVLQNILGPDNSSLVFMSSGAVSFMLAYIFIVSVYEG